MIAPEEVMQHAAALYRAGHLSEAEELCRNLLLTEPRNAAANHFLGSMALQQRQAKRAQPYLKLAWEVNPEEGQHWLTLVECLLECGSFEDALALANQAIRRGIETQQMRELVVRAKRGISRKSPSEAVADEVLALFKTGRNAELEIRVIPLLKQYPGWAFGWRALGAAMSSLGRDAEAVLRRAMQLAPKDASAPNNLGVILREQGRLAESLTCLSKALKNNPESAEAYCNKGDVLQELGRFDESIASYRKAIAIRPNYFDAQAQLSNVLSSHGQVPEALTVLEKLMGATPDNAKALSNLLYGVLLRGDVDADALSAMHRRFAELFEEPLRDAWPTLANAPEPERCIRVGFVSGDFHLHAVANFIEPVVMHLAQSARLSLHAYYNHTQEDDLTQRLKGCFAQWNAVFGQTDEGLAQQIRADGIDILIDLSGHTRNNRLLTFARKPAPIQVSWMGYPGTTGLQAMDYYLADRFLLPAGRFDQQFTEKIVCLPGTAPFLPAQESPPVKALPALTNGYITFGSFNRLNKITRPVVALWSRLMSAVPGSKMLMGAMPEGDDHGRLVAWFAGEGVARDRLIFYPRTDITGYLKLHHQVDFCLDTFPYGGGTTTLHAIWMGVPTLTLAGKTVPARQGAALLGHVGLNEFVAQDEVDFVQKGLRLAGDVVALAELRSGMRERFARSSLGQPALIAAGLESALRTMWRRWCAGLPPESFDADATFDAEFNASAILQHAATFYQAGRLAEAEELCMSILQSEPTHADTNYNLGLMALQQGQAERALPYLQVAWEANPAEGGYWLTLTECLLALARFEDALGLIEAAIQRGLDTPEARQLYSLASQGVARSKQEVD